MSALRRAAHGSGWLFSLEGGRQKNRMRRQPEGAVLLQLESSCASHVRTRTTPLRHCSLSATTAADLPSAAHRAPAQSSATPARFPRLPTLTSPFAARTAVARRTTSPALRKPHLDFLHKTCPPQGTALGIVHQSDYYSVMREAQLHFASPTVDALRIALLGEDKFNGKNHWNSKMV